MSDAKFMKQCVAEFNQRLFQIFPAICTAAQSFPDAKVSERHGHQQSKELPLSSGQRRSLFPIETECPTFPPCTCSVKISPVATSSRFQFSLTHQHIEDDLDAADTIWSTEDYQNDKACTAKRSYHERTGCSRAPCTKIEPRNCRQ